MKLIINADDFGFSESINNGIIDAYKEGLISSTTIMINMPYAEDAIQRWKENSGLGLGLHINLTQGSPISNNVSSLVDENNTFHKHRKVENEQVEITYEDAYTEIKAQIDKLLSYKVEIDHLDTHHFIHLNPSIRKALTTLAKEYNLPLRTMDDDFRKKVKSLGIKTPDIFSFDFYDEGASWETIANFVEKYKGSNSIEILTHCGYIDEDTKKRTGYILREVELNELRKLKDNSFYKEYPLSKYSDL